MISLFIHFVLSVFLKHGVASAVTVTSPSEVVGVKGGEVTFRINYTLGSGEDMNAIKVQISDEVRVFQAPLIEGDTWKPKGKFFGVYKSRASTDYSEEKTDFTMTLSKLTASDENLYRVYVGLSRGEPANSYTKIFVDLLPSRPSISGAPTEPVLGGAGPTNLTCTANLGRPQASMVWSRRTGNAEFTNIAGNVKSGTTNNTDGSTSGTSTLTVNLNLTDNGVQFRCQVSNRQATYSAETATIKVTGTNQPTGNRKRGDTTKPTGNGDGGDTSKPTRNGDGGDTTKPTGNGDGGDTSTPTRNGDGGVSAGCKNIPSTIILWTAFLAKATISTTG